MLGTLDLVLGFHQIRVAEECQEMTSFGCTLGKFKFLRMPFGLKNAPAVFQQVVDKVLSKAKDCAVNYIDDVLVYSNNWNDHMKDLNKVLKCLGDAGV